MDFSIPEKLAPVLREIHDFVNEVLIAEEPELLHAGFFTAEARLGALREQVKAKGWWLPQAPRELGGMGLSVLEHGLVSEVLGRSPYGQYVFGCQAPDAGNL
ncbi:MAG: acyl-CoA dehydrogenase family protein, partial [Polyangiaceae bacterium]